MIGRTISHYTLLDLLGEGGMGVVYKAEDTRLKRVVALKFLKSHVPGCEEERARFLREAQAAACLEHPNICTVYEIDERDGQTFIAMAYCGGRDLKTRIKEGSMPVADVLDIACQIIAGLEEAHAQGIIHRDIKSANIMISPKGQVKIMDFGIAKLVSAAQSTWSGTIAGTAAYMSPEQARGGAVDARTDLWSFGVVLFEMLTGALPFGGDTEVAVVHSLLYEPAPSIRNLRPDCPEGLEKIVQACLEKNPERRYLSAAGLGQDLRNLKAQHGATATMRTPSGRPVGPARAARRRQRRRIAVGASILAAIALILLFVPAVRKTLSSRAGLGSIPAQMHLAVLPFKNVSGAPEDQRICDGLMELLVSRLTQLERFHHSLWVIPTSEVLGLGIGSAGRARSALGATLAITGSSQRRDSEIILTLNLIDTKTLRQLRSEVFSSRPENTLVFQDEIVFRSADMLGIEVSSDIRRELTLGGTGAPGANHFYIQGLGYLEHYEREEDIDAAIDCFRRAVELDGRYALAHAVLGEAYWRKYELTDDRAWADAAREACGRAVRIDDGLVQVHITLGLIAAGTGRNEEALREFEKALAMDPENSEAALGYAAAFEAAGKIDRAEEIYKKAISLRPGRWAGYSHLGVFYYGQGRWEDAERMFQEVIRLAPDNFRGYNNLMGIYYLMGRQDRVREMFERSVAIRPNPDAYSNFATILFFQGKYPEALTSYEEAIRLGQNSYEIWGNLADCYRYCPGREGKAEEAYQKAIALAGKKLSVNSRNAELRAKLSLYYAMSGKSGNALAELKEARAIMPRSVLVLRKAVQVLERVGRRNDALAALKEYLAAGGSPDEIKSDPDLAEMRRDARYGQAAKGRPATIGNHG
jgi:tetratricopeptide (TPR) repeat protein/TolB-like protein